MIGLELLYGQILLEARTDDDSWNFRDFDKSHLRTLFRDLTEL
jgi:hypothetical protein